MLQWHLISRHLLQVWTAWDCSLPFTCNSAAHSSLYLLLPQRKPIRPHQWQVTLLYPVRCAVHLMSVSAASCVVHLTTSLPPSHCCSVRIISELLWNFTKLVSWRSYPCQPQRITSGLKTNFNLSPCYSFHKSSYHKSLFLNPQLKFYPQFQNAKPDKQNACSGQLKPICIPWPLNMGTWIQQSDLFSAAGPHRNPC